VDIGIEHAAGVIADLDDLLRQVEGMGRGTRYYVPRTR
jgi:hypothetical protein